MTGTPKRLGRPRHYEPGERVYAQLTLSKSLLARIDAARGTATRSDWMAAAAAEKLEREKGKGGE